MSNLGLGVMTQQLGGNEDTVAALQHAIGRTLTGVTLDGGFALRLGLDDGQTLVIADDGQSCCEDRFMTCDDDLGDFAGATLVEVEIRDAPSRDHDGCEHEVQFLVVTTSKGVITAETHNVHNGYYGGFAIQASLRRPGQR
jgi:hypothetical protein